MEKFFRLENFLTMSNFYVLKEKMSFREGK